MLLKKSPLLILLLLWVNTLNAQCNFTIIASDSTICEKEVVTFSIGNAPTGIKTIEWDFGFKQINNNSKPLVIFNTYGIYDAKLILELNSSKRCSVEIKNFITVNALPDMGNVVANKKEICKPGDFIEFSSTSNRAVKWEWTVESNYVSGKKSSITHKTENSGWPYVQLSLESKEGCTNKQIFDSIFQVLQKPKVDLSKTNVLVCEVPGTLHVIPQFNYKETKITRYLWDFEGASNEIDQNEVPKAKHYANPGVYDIKLEMRSVKGCKFKYEFKDTVKVVDVSAADIKAYAMGGKGCLSMRHKIIVKGLDTSLYHWEFNRSDVKFVDSTEMDSTVFLFAKEGNHTIYLRMKKGPCDIRYPLKITAGNSDLLADFSMPYCLCDANDSLIAKNKSKSKGPVTYEWKVSGRRGFKINSTDKNLSEVMGRYGKFWVMLRITDQNGCADAEMKRVEVKKNNIEPIEVKRIACLGDRFTLVQDSFCKVDSSGVTWRFYDNNGIEVVKKVGFDVKVFFPAEGIYSVSVVLRSTSGCVDSFYFKNHLLVKDCFGELDIEAAFFPDSGCVGEIKIKVDSIIGIFKVDAKLVLQSDTTITFNGNYKRYWITFKPILPGIYNLKVRISTQNGLQFKDYYIKNIARVNHLRTTGEIGKTWGCFPNKITELKTVKVENTMYYGNIDTLVSYKWEAFPFDKGRIANDKAMNTTITTFEAGQVDIELTAINSTGCKAKWQSVNKLNENLKVEFFMPKDACYGDTIVMNNKSIGAIVKYEWRSDKKGDAFAPNAFVKEPQFFANGEGKREIQLAITDTNGCEAFIIKEIQLVDIDLDFSVADTTPKCSPATYFFKPQGRNVEDYEWDFGDGDKLKTKKTKQIPKIYDLRRVSPYRNVFTVSLTGKHSSGCVQKVVKPELIKIRGPYPKFELSNLVGCSPHKIELKDVSVNVEKLYFDYGDRTTVDTTVGASHIYVTDTSKEVEYFRPYVVAHDKYDCRVGFYLEDTIKVYSMPVARFTASPKKGCEPLTVKMKSISRFAEENDWFIPQAGVNDNGKKSVNILNAGVYDVQLLVRNKIGCTDVLIKPKVYTVFENPKAVFALDDTVACVGRGLKFIDLSFSNAAITSYEWRSQVGNQKDSGFAKLYTPVFDEDGDVDAQLIIIDDNTCTDTFSIEKAAKVYKDLPVKAPSFSYVSHLNNKSIEINWSQINLAYARRLGILAQIGSDAKKIEIPELETTYVEFQHDSLPNQSNCFKIELIDKCRDVHPSISHCSVHLDVDKTNKTATELSWNHYNGWDSIANYKVLRSSENSDYLLLATLPGWQSTYIDSSFCDSVYNYKVVADCHLQPYSSNSNTLKHKTKYTNQDVPLEVIVTTVENNNEIATYWHKSKQLGNVEYQISKMEQLSANNKIWKTVRDTFIKDYRVKIDDFHYTYRVRVKDKCGYVAGKSNIGRSIVLNVNQTDNNIVLGWNRYEHWEKGVKEYIVEVRPPNEKWFRELNTVTDTIIEDPEAYLNYEEPYRYRVKAVENGESPDTSYSNERIVIPVPSVFAPNAFSPNGDGVNDEFNIAGWALLEDLEDISEFNLVVFNRWGERVFESYDISDGWDGTFNGNNCQLDQYIWLAKVTALNGKIYFLKGGVLLMR